MFCFLFYNIFHHVAVTHQILVQNSFSATKFHSHFCTYVARTYPADGTFTPPQRDLYSAVLAAQKALVALCHEGSNLTLHELHRKSCELLRQELLQLGFQLHPGDLERLYPHFISHPIGIGMDSLELLIVPNRSYIPCQTCMSPIVFRGAEGTYICVSLHIANYSPSHKSEGWYGGHS